MAPSWEVFRWLAACVCGVIRDEEVILTLPISWLISSTDNLTKRGSTRTVNQVGGEALSGIVLETTGLVCWSPKTLFHTAGAVTIPGRFKRNSGVLMAPPSSGCSRMGLESIPVHFVERLEGARTRLGGSKGPQIGGCRRYR